MFFLLLCWIYLKFVGDWYVGDLNVCVDEFLLFVDDVFELVILCYVLEVLVFL